MELQPNSHKSLKWGQSHYLFPHVYTHCCLQQSEGVFEVSNEVDLR